mmetsp:Transcript_36597/g.99043  ORF Transcript_36597/g.99043 Transcript_36597/m.99043 type:complete len:201 (-) Transcript_36597:1189-1791(-)
MQPQTRFLHRPHASTRKPVPPSCRTENKASGATHWQTPPSSLGRRLVRAFAPRERRSCVPSPAAAGLPLRGSGPQRHLEMMIRCCILLRRSDRETSVSTARLKRGARACILWVLAFGAASPSGASSRSAPSPPARFCSACGSSDCDPSCPTYASMRCTGRLMARKGRKLRFAGTRLAAWTSSSLTSLSMCSRPSPASSGL